MKSTEKSRRRFRRVLWAGAAALLGVSVWTVAQNAGPGPAAAGLPERGGLGAGPMPARPGEPGPAPFAADPMRGPAPFPGDLKMLIQASDEEWKVIGPRLRDVLVARQTVEADRSAWLLMAGDAAMTGPMGGRGGGPFGGRGAFTAPGEGFGGPGGRGGRGGFGPADGGGFGGGAGGPGPMGEGPRGGFGGPNPQPGVGPADGMGPGRLIGPNPGPGVGPGPAEGGMGPGGFGPRGGLGGRGMEGPGGDLFGGRRGGRDGGPPDRGGFGPQGGPAGPGGPGRPGGPTGPGPGLFVPFMGGPGGGMDAIGQAELDLKAVLDDPNSTDEQVQEKLQAVREARAQAKARLHAAQADLMELLTADQVAVLVSLGYLD